MKTAKRLSTDEPPTVEQVATLAAALARTGEDSPDALAKRALELWRASEVALWKDASSRRRLELSRARPHDLPLPPVDIPCEQAIVAKDGIRWPTNYPITADDFPGLVVPRLQGKTAEAADSIKDWLWWIERWKGDPQAGVPVIGGADRHAPEVEPQVDQLFTAWRRRELSQADFEFLATNFAYWYTVHHAAEVSKARGAAGRQGGRPPKKAKGRKPRRTQVATEKNFEKLLGLNRKR